VDVVYAAAGGSGVGVFQSALAKKKLAIGVDSDQYESVGDPKLQPVIMTSMIKRVDVAVYSSLEKFQKKEDIPAVSTFDLSTDGIGYATSGGQVDDIKAQLDDLKKQIIDGSIKVPTTP
jgi:basic membrane protein A